jgi:hypothetical protein
MTTTTTNNTARLILAMQERTAGLAEALAGGIDASRASQKPTMDGKVVDCNHPTFVYGHLSIYPQMIMESLGAEPGSAGVPESYTKLFMHGAECQHDPEGSIYPDFEEVRATFKRTYGAVREHLATLDEETLNQAITSNDRLREVFGTCDAMSLFMLHDHYMFHLGQLSTWRRCMGLGSVM